MPSSVSVTPDSTVAAPLFSVAPLSILLLPVTSIVPLSVMVPPSMAAPLSFSAAP